VYLPASGRRRELQWSYGSEAKLSVCLSWRGAVSDGCGEAVWGRGVCIHEGNSDGVCTDDQPHHNTAVCDVLEPAGSVVKCDRREISTVSKQYLCTTLYTEYDRLLISLALGVVNMIRITQFPCKPRVNPHMQ